MAVALRRAGSVRDQRVEVEVGHVRGGCGGIGAPPRRMSTASPAWVLQRGLPWMRGRWDSEEGHVTQQKALALFWSERLDRRIAARRWRLSPEEVPPPSSGGFMLPNPPRSNPRGRCAPERSQPQATGQQPPRPGRARLALCRFVLPALKGAGASGCLVCPGSGSDKKVVAQRRR